MLANVKGGGVRHSIDQGLIRAELATNADKEFLRVYKSGTVAGSVAGNRVTGAIENYKSAVACFVRALPSFEDANSSKLIKDEIRRMLARLNELERIQREIDPENATDGEDNNSRFLQDLKFKVGDLVQVDPQQRRGRITAVDYESGTYGIVYDDNGQQEQSVVESRLTLAPPPSSSSASSSSADADASAQEAERIRIWSEIIESERVYCHALKQDLVLHYLGAFDSPMQWLGQKSAVDTVFTQKTLSPQERQKVFGNVEELAGTSELVLQSLEQKFAQYGHQDVKLAAVFLDCSSLLLEPYAAYADAYYSSRDLLAKIKKERGSAFEAIEMRVMKEFGSPQLEELMRLPLERAQECQRLLLELHQRTPRTHPDYTSIRQAYVLFSRVALGISQSLNRLEMERALQRLEQQFNPSISLVRRGRELVLFREQVQKLDPGGKRTARAVWLFNDLVVVGRKSEWFASGQYRVLQQLVLKRARSAPEFGPLAVEIAAGNDSGEVCLLVLASEQDKQEWMHALRQFIVQPPQQQQQRRPSAVPPPRSSVTTRSPIPPPPPPPPPPPQQQWVRAKALYALPPDQLPSADCLAFQVGEVVEIMPLHGTTGGWAKGRVRGKTGKVPMNYLQVL